MTKFSEILNMLKLEDERRIVEYMRSVGEARTYQIATALRISVDDVYQACDHLMRTNQLKTDLKIGTTAHEAHVLQYNQLWQYEGTLNRDA